MTLRAGQLDEVWQLADSVDGATAPDWVATVARWATAGDWELALIRGTVTDLSNTARGCRQRPPTLDDVPAPLRGPRGRMVLAIARCQRWKGERRFDLLAQEAQQALAGENAADALLLAMLAAGLFGQGGHSASARSRAIRAVDRSLASTNADQVSRTICLEALSLVDDLTDQDERVHSLAQDMIDTGEADGYHHYLHASALRRLGRYDEAVDAINTAFVDLDTMSEFFQICVRERELISATRQMDNRARALTAELTASLKTEIQRHADAARTAVSDSLVKVVEILGLFLTLVGFLVSGGALAFQATSFGNKALSLVLLTFGALAFFLLLRGAVRFRRR